MKFTEKIKEQFARQKKLHAEEIIEKENKSQQKTALKLLAGFFAFMLLFTLLSRSADGLTIAVVETKYIDKGTVSHEVNATGEVVSDSRLNLQSAAGLTIEKLSAKQGQSVKSGEELMTFNDESAELLLDRLKNELAALKLKKENSGEANESGLTAAKRTLDNAEYDYKRSKEKSEQAIKLANEAFLQSIDDYNKLYEQYEYQEYIDKRWKQWVDEPLLTDSDLSMLYPSENDDPERAAWKTNVQAARAALKAARQKCIDANRSNDSLLVSNNTEQISNERTIQAARLAYDEAVKSGNKSSSQASVDINGYSIDIKEKQADLDLLSELKKSGWKLLAPTDGVLIAIKGEVGGTTAKGEIAALSKNSEGYKVNVTVTKQQMKFMKQGDEVYVELMQNGENATVKAIIEKISLAEEKDSYSLSLTLPDGVYLVGENAKMSFSQESELYYSCLPISALRSDSGGSNFVLVAFEKDTVLGKEAVAKRVEIEIKDRDSKTMEVTGALLPEDKVIVSSNKSIEKNDRVRIEQP